jgi:hypothetical protein
VGPGRVQTWNGTAWTVQPGSGGAGWAALSCASANACLAARADPTAAIADSWDGIPWTALPLPQLQLDSVNPFYSAVSCSAVNACTIVMNTAITSQFTSSLEAVAFRWDGANWSAPPLPSPFQSGGPVLNGVSCASATACIAVGQRTIIIPDGNPKYALLQTVPYILSYS